MAKTIKFKPTTDYYKESENLFKNVAHLKEVLALQTNKPVPEKIEFEKFNPHKDYFKTYQQLLVELNDLNEEIIRNNQLLQLEEGVFDNLDN